MRRLLSFPVGRGLGVVFAVSLSVLGLACSSGEQSAFPGLTHPKSIDDRIPAPLRARMARADHVEAVLLTSTLAGIFPDSSRNRATEVGDFPVRSGYKRLTTTQASELSRLLMDRTSYQNEIPTCTFHPNIAFRYVAPAETVEVLVCHGCDQISIRSGTLLGGGTAFAIGTRLEALSNALFPDDGEIDTLRAMGLRDSASFRKRYGR